MAIDGTKGTFLIQDWLGIAVRPNQDCFGGPSFGGCQPLFRQPSYRPWMIPLIQREEVIGRRLVNVLCDSSLSDANINLCDFLYVADNACCFRMPCDQGIGDLLPRVE